SQSLIHAANASGNTFLAGRLRSAAPPVDRGTRLSDALKATRVLPRMALDMISTGEQTGNMDEMLDRVAEYTENEAEVAVFQSTLILGVLLLLAVAAYVGIFVVQYYVGMYRNVLND
ncbi:MAG: type II secretion system F family protein, partial [Armatimonadetes bacterium]|nr:type II secretion system F family protein [Armatimonadota bacterium]